MLIEDLPSPLCCDYNYILYTIALGMTQCNGAFSINQTICKQRTIPRDTTITANDTTAATTTSSTIPQNKLSQLPLPLCLHHHLHHHYVKCKTPHRADKHTLRPKYTHKLTHKCIHTQTHTHAEDAPLALFSNVKVLWPIWLICITQ